jgi:hypothetical protein
MSSQPEGELIHIIFTIDDIEFMADEAGIDLELALERAEKWARYIEDAAVSLINDQLFSCVEYDSP